MMHTEVDNAAPLSAAQHGRTQIITFKQSPSFIGHLTPFRERLQAILL